MAAGSSDSDVRRKTSVAMCQMRMPSWISSRRYRLRSPIEITKPSFLAIRLRSASWPLSALIKPTESVAAPSSFVSSAEGLLTLDQFHDTFRNLFCCGGIVPLLTSCSTKLQYVVLSNRTGPPPSIMRVDELAEVLQPAVKPHPTVHGCAVQPPMSSSRHAKDQVGERPARSGCRQQRHHV
ncbi:Os04g0142850 [Oryza sativa Japonica Group]|uniref:Os04g0142850 protein n=1 Tax=Oryza sativa subsp. japonica TaxID=39947 RepID=A0A0P0W6S9_ORYSJ|nr:Os04g0142850 [Oryza sativa Japonica Group]